MGRSVWYIIPLPCRARARSNKWCVYFIYHMRQVRLEKVNIQNGGNKSLVLVQGWFAVGYVDGAVMYNI